MFFEQARAQAQNEYEQDGSNAAVSLHRKYVVIFMSSTASWGLDSLRVCQALTRWGGALLELAHFRQGEDAREMIKEVSNLPLYAHFALLTCISMWAQYAGRLHAGG